jgi:hypothetical protein
MDFFHDQYDHRDCAIKMELLTMVELQFATPTENIGSIDCQVPSGVYPLFVHHQHHRTSSVISGIVFLLITLICIAFVGR